MWPRGRSELATLIREFDWQSTGLGPIAEWPPVLRTAVDLILHSPVPMVMLWGDDGVMIYNDPYAVFAGQRHPHVLGSKVLEGWPEVAEFNRRVMRVVYEEGGTLEFTREPMVLTLRGAPETVWLDLYYSPILGPEGRREAVLAIVVEVTEAVHEEQQRRLAEASLRASEARFEFLASLGDAVRMVTEPSEILTSSTGTLARFLHVPVCSYAEVEADEDHFTLLQHAVRDDEIRPAGSHRVSDFGPTVAEAMRGGRTLAIADVTAEMTPAEAQASIALGARAFVSCPLHKGGRLVALLAVHQDTPRLWTAAEIDLIEATAERCWAYIEWARAARSLRESEEHYRFMADAIPQMVWTAAPDGRIDYVNRQAASYFALPAEALAAEGWEARIHADDAEEAMRQWRHSVRTGELYESSFRLRRADGQWRWHLVRALPLRGSGGRIVRWFGTCTDYEDQRRNEDRLRRANADLEQFAYSASHDLQAPLRQMITYGQLLERRYKGKLDSQADNFIQHIVEGGQHMSMLVRDLLEYVAVLETGDEGPPETDATAIAARTLYHLKALLREQGAEVEFGELPPVAMQGVHLQQLLQNLITNAVKYRKPDEPPRVTVEALRSGNRVQFTVADNGIGIDPQYHERIFGIFKRLHGREEYPGTGIGLALCQKIVDRYGGRIWVESQPGRGSRFHFVVPAPEE